MKLNKLAFALGLGLAASAGGAVADVQLWSFQDDSIDFLLRPNTAGGLDLLSTGTISAGDVFVSVFEINTATKNPPGTSLIPAGKELTGVSVIQLVTKNADVNGDGLGDGIWAFAPYTAGMNTILTAAGASGVGTVGDAGGGAMAAMWLNDRPATQPTNPSDDRNLIVDASAVIDGVTGKTNCTSLNDCIYQAALGTKFQVDGLWGANSTDRSDADNFWIAQPLLGGDNINTVKAGAETKVFGLISFQLSNLFNIVEPVLFQNVNTGDPCAAGTTYSAVPDSCVQVTGSANILGGKGLSNGAIAHDDLDARKLVSIPEPASLALLGLGLLGLGTLRRQVK